MSGSPRTCVRRYQWRGLLHFHATIRIAGPGWPADPALAGLALDAFRDAVLAAARTVCREVARSDRSALVLGGGAQVDVRYLSGLHIAQLDQLNHDTDDPNA
ncbi:MAG: replication initiator, partial [Actinomycetes bacterium]